MLVSISHDQLFKNISGKPYWLVAVVSFEERATAWASFLNSHEALPEKAFVFDYDTIAEPKDADTELRNQCRSVFTRTLNRQHKTAHFLKGVNAFAANSLTEQISSLINESAGLPVLIDISCMTRVHLLALAAGLRTRQTPEAELYFCYAAPVAYGFQRANRIGWRDVLFIPAGKRRMFKREGFSRGIILAGYDGERLSVALQELEPASGTMIYAKNSARPDFLLKAHEANEIVERRLRELRMPRANNPVEVSDDWKFEIVDVEDFEGLSSVLRKQVQMALRDGGPVIVFPFGPKPMSLSIALSLRDWDVGEAWAVYPVPDRFSVTYTQGVAELYVYRHEKTVLGEAATSSVGN